MAAVAPHPFDWAWDVMPDPMKAGGKVAILVIRHQAGVDAHPMPPEDLARFIVNAQTALEKIGGTGPQLVIASTVPEPMPPPGRR
jgi:hypothetical protein